MKSLWYAYLYVYQYEENVISFQVHIHWALRGHNLHRSFDNFQYGPKANINCSGLEYTSITHVCAIQNSIVAFDIFFTNDHGSCAMWNALIICPIIKLPGAWITKKFPLRKSKDHVYGTWVHKSLGIWKGHHREKNPLVSCMKPWTQARNNNKNIKYHSKPHVKIHFI